MKLTTEEYERAIQLVSGYDGFEPESIISRALLQAHAEREQLREALLKLKAKWDGDGWVTDQEEMARMCDAALATVEGDET